MSLSKPGLTALRVRAEQEIEVGLLPACQYAVAVDGEVVAHETLGAAGTDARFSVWSSSKPVFTAVVWQLMSEGLLDPTARVAEQWPQFASNGKGKITLDHLLQHTAGIPGPPVADTIIADRAERVHAMERWPLEWEPGTRSEYHGLSAYAVMAELVERVTQTDYRIALRERVLDPLGLHRIELGVPADRQADLMRMVDTGDPVTLEEVAEALGVSTLPPELVEMLAGAAAGTAASAHIDLHALQAPEVVEMGAPGAGIVSDAASMALFYQALLHNPAELWSPAVLSDVTSVVRNTFPVPPLNVLAMRTRGLEIQGDDPTAKYRPGGGAASPRTFGHGGAAGQIAWADPDTGLSFCYLTNGQDRNPIRQARRVRELSAAAAACIG